MYVSILFVAAVVGQDSEISQSQLTPPSEIRGAYGENDGGALEAARSDRFGRSTRVRIGEDAPPANFESPLQMDPREAKRADEAAIVVLRYAITPPERDLIFGRQTTLQEVLDRVAGSRERAMAAKGYWKLTDALMSYHLAYHEARFLETLPESNAEVDEALISAARSDALANEVEAKQVVVDAQHALSEVVAATGREIPLPSDLPLISAYRTRIDEIYPGDSAPHEMRRIDRSLPYLLTSIRHRAIAVTSAVNATEAVRDGYSNGQIPATTLIAIHTNLHHHRRQFLSSVRRYNELIADYAMNVSGGMASSTQAVTMLIGRSRRSSGTFNAGEVVPANASNFVDPRSVIRR